MSYCSTFPCTVIDCEGCKDGKKWCDDPRCTPYCRSCPLPKGHDEAANFVFGITLFLLILIIISLIMFYGPRFFIFRNSKSDDTYSADVEYDMLDFEIID